MDIFNITLINPTLVEHLEYLIFFPHPLCHIFWSCASCFRTVLNSESPHILLECSLKPDESHVLPNATSSSYHGQGHLCKTRELTLSLSCFTASTSSQLPKERQLGICSQTPQRAFLSCRVSDDNSLPDLISPHLSTHSVLHTLQCSCWKKTT